MKIINKIKCFFGSHKLVNFKEYRAEVFYQVNFCLECPYEISFHIKEDPAINLEEKIVKALMEIKNENI